MEATRVNAAALEAFCVAAMTAAGIGREDAELSARVFVTTDTWGTFTHGTRQIRGLMKNARRGRLAAGAREKIVAEGPSWAMVDARDGMPPAISCRATMLAVDKARHTGMAYVGVRGSSHFGAAGYYANLIAEQGMFGMAMCNVEPCMTVPGARSRILGTNPIAWAAPTGTGRTIMLDIATSAVAATKIFAAKTEGRSIPDTWLVDDAGAPTTDPTIYPEHGAQLPMAGHKGYGLAVLVEILTAVLTGSAMMGEVHSWVADDPVPPNQGHAFLALDVGAMMPREAVLRPHGHHERRDQGRRPRRGRHHLPARRNGMAAPRASPRRRHRPARGRPDQPARPRRRQRPRPHPIRPEPRRLKSEKEPGQHPCQGVLDNGPIV